MLYKIDEYLISQGIHKAGSFDLAWGIITIIENAGMLPPPEKSEVYDLNDDGLHFLITYKFNPDETGNQKTNWKPENEKT